MKEPSRDPSIIEELLESLSNEDVPDSLERRIDGLFSERMHIAKDVQKNNESILAKWRNFIMKRKYEFALSTLLFIAIVAVMQMSPTQSSLAATFEKIRSATSMVVVCQIGRNGEYPHAKTFYWKAPDRIRAKMGAANDFRHTDWWLNGESVVTVDHKIRLATVLKGAALNHPVARELREKIIGISTPEGVLNVLSSDCKKTESIQEDGQELDVYKGTAKDFNSPISGIKNELIAYIDSKTQLPARIDIREDISQGSDAYRCFRLTFHWNDKLADDIFTPDIPAGYKIRELDGDETAEPQTIKPGEGVGDIRFHMSRDEVIELWGEPDLISDRCYWDANDKPKEYLELHYYDRGADIEIIPGIGVASIDGHHSSICRYAVTQDFMGKTPEGVGIGMTEEEIVQRMGNPLKRDEIEDSRNSTFVRLFYPNKLCFRLMSGYINNGEEIHRVCAISCMSEDSPLQQG